MLLLCNFCKRLNNKSHILHASTSWMVRYSKCILKFKNDLNDFALYSKHAITPYPPVKVSFLFWRQRFLCSVLMFCSLTCMVKSLAYITLTVSVYHLKHVTVNVENSSSLSLSSLPLKPQTWLLLWAGSQLWSRVFSPLMCYRNSVFHTFGGTSSFYWLWSGTAWSWSCSSWHPECVQCWTGSSSRRSAFPTSRLLSTMETSTPTETSSSAATDSQIFSWTESNWRKETASPCLWTTSQTSCAFGSGWQRSAARLLSLTQTSSPGLCCTALTAAEPKL